MQSLILPTIKNGFAFNIDYDLVANYRLNPFDTSDIIFNKNLPLSETIDAYFKDRFKGRNFIYTANGRHAISLALETLKLEPNDFVTIFTTTNNKYISGCVTNEIEKYCKWSRNIEKNTKVLFVNHEFGFACDNIYNLRTYGLPIIEDYCYSFYSEGTHVGSNHESDFTLYSFAKYFPIQLGGLLTASKNYQLPERVIDNLTELYIKQVLSYYQGDIIDIALKRRYNYSKLAERLKEFGFTQRFILTENDAPGVFMFCVPNYIDLQLMKEYLWKLGIHCSVFYGEQTFFIPVHQRLTELDFEYFFTCIKSFLGSKETNQV